MPVSAKLLDRKREITRRIVEEMPRTMIQLKIRE
jgi:hypothetical protein